MKTGATFSPDRVYRYTLVRDWRGDIEAVGGLSGPIAHFVCLNPSTADETTNDPTVRRCIGFARSWGYGGLVLTNIFAYRATNPKHLPFQRDPSGPDNDDAIMSAAQTSAITVMAWGDHGKLQRRGEHVIAMLHEAGIGLHYLVKTLSGQPGHPLYLPSHLWPRPWRP